jgi:hypothetical protein
MRIGRGLEIPGSKYLEGRLLRIRTPNLVDGALKTFPVTATNA